MVSCVYHNTVIREGSIMGPEIWRKLQELMEEMSTTFDNWDTEMQRTGANEELMGNDQTAAWVMEWEERIGTMDEFHDNGILLSRMCFDSAMESIEESMGGGMTNQEKVVVVVDYALKLLECLIEMKNNMGEDRSEYVSFFDRFVEIKETDFD
jgi:hypothetical protein